MRKAVPFVLVLIALLVWLAMRPRTGARREVESTPSADSSAKDRSGDPGTLSAPESGRRAPVAHVAGEADQEAAATLPSPETHASCVLFGRVVDEDERAIVGVTVTLMASPHWDENADVPKLSGDWECEGYELRTDAEGGFRVQAPVPTASFVYLHVHPDDFHDFARVRYGGSDRGDAPPLHSGENDLGTFKLATTGSLSGSVHDKKGAPIAGAHVRLGASLDETEKRQADTDSVGHYVIGHAAEGSHGVVADAEGYKEAFLTPFEVKRNQVTPGPDFVLAEASTLSGHVQDEAGRPLNNVRLWGSPSRSGSGAGATSKEDGSFVIYLPQDEPYSLEAELSGYEPYHVNDRRTQYQPGTHDIVCVMKLDVLTTFVVVDSETGAPIPRFDINIMRNRGSAAWNMDFTWTEWVPQYENHPGGECKVGARPGVDRFQVAAPDHSRLEGEVKHESASSPRQVVRLGRGASLTGRVIARGAPVQRASVKLEGGGFTPAHEKGPSRIPAEFNADSGNLKFTTSDGQGRFRALGLDPGDYRLTIRNGSATPLVLVPIDVKAGRALDLGDLVLPAGSTIEGLVRMERGSSPLGLRVFLDDERDGAKSIVQADGSFRFENVSPGNHMLNICDAPSRLASGPPQEVEIADGETKKVVLNVSDRAVCVLAVRVMLSGQPAAGVRVACEGGSPARHFEGLGRTGADGGLRSPVRAIGPCHVRVYDSNGVPLGSDPQQIDLVSGASLERVIDVVGSTLDIEWPAEDAVPVGGEMYANISSKDPDSRPSGCSLQAGPGDGPQAKDTNHCAIAAIGPGEYHIVLLLPRSESKGGNGEKARDGYDSLEDRTVILEGDVVVVAGTPAHVALQESQHR